MCDRRCSDRGRVVGSRKRFIFASKKKEETKCKNESKRDESKEENKNKCKCREEEKSDKIENSSENSTQ